MPNRSLQRDAGTGAKPRDARCDQRYARAICALRAVELGRAEIETSVSK
jgi:hypothetical protein